MSDCSAFRAARLICFAACAALCLNLLSVMRHALLCGLRCQAPWFSWRHAPRLAYRPALQSAIPYSAAYTAQRRALLSSLRCNAPWFVRRHALRLAQRLAPSSASVSAELCAVPCFAVCATKRYTLLSIFHCPASRLAQRNAQFSTAALTGLAPLNSVDSYTISC